MKKTLVAISIMILSAAQAQARWHCSLECKRSVDTVYSQFPKHGSSTDYSDFKAACEKVAGAAVTRPESGCDYIYCKKFSKTVDILNGEGDSLTEARQNARSGCPQGGAVACDIMKFNEIGNYNCSEM